MSIATQHDYKVADGDGTAYSFTQRLDALGSILADGMPEAGETSRDIYMAKALSALCMSEAQRRQP